MFAYCGNNSVRYVDYTGEARTTTLYDSSGSSEANTNRVKYNVPLYKQGKYKLCWAYCQAMVESWDANKTLSARKAFKRVKEIAVACYGETNWNQGGWPSNRGARRTISSIEDLYYLLRGQGPVYAYYSNGKTGKNASAHLVVVTGVDLDRGIVYTNNPWGIKGKQTFNQFKNGVAKRRNQSSQGLKFRYVYLIDY